MPSGGQDLCEVGVTESLEPLRLPPKAPPPHFRVPPRESPAAIAHDSAEESGGRDGGGRPSFDMVLPSISEGEGGEDKVSDPGSQASAQQSVAGAARAVAAPVPHDSAGSVASSPTLGTVGWGGKGRGPLERQVSSLFRAWVRERVPKGGGVCQWVCESDRTLLFRLDAPGSWTQYLDPQGAGTFIPYWWNAASEEWFYIDPDATL